MKPIQWPQITIGGEKFEMVYNWRAMRRLGVDNPPANLNSIDDHLQVATVAAAMISSDARPIDPEWVLDTALPFEAIRISQAVKECFDLARELESQAGKAIAAASGVVLH